MCRKHWAVQLPLPIPLSPPTCLAASLVALVTLSLAPTPSHLSLSLCLSFSPHLSSSSPSLSHFPSPRVAFACPLLSVSAYSCHQRHVCLFKGCLCGAFVSRVYF